MTQVYPKVKADVESCANPPNLDVALSTRASESTLSSINDKIVKCDTDNVSIVNFPSDYPDSTTHSKLDTINSTLQTNLPRKIIADDGSGTYAEIQRTGNNLNVQIKGDDIGLAKESTLSSINSKITVCDTSNVSGTVTARLQGFDGSNWQNLQVESSDYPNLKVGIFYRNKQAEVWPHVGDAQSGSTNKLDVAAFLMGFNGSSWDRLRCDANKYLLVTLGADNVGLAKESTLSSINSKIVTCDTSNISGVIEVLPRKVVLEYDLANISVADLISKPFISVIGEEFLRSDADGAYATSDYCSIHINLPQTRFPERLEFQAKWSSESNTYIQWFVRFPKTSGGDNKFQLICMGNGTDAIIRFDYWKDGTSWSVSHTVTADTFYTITAEIAPNVPWVRIRYDGTQLALVNWEGYFDQIVRYQTNYFYLTPSTLYRLKYIKIWLTTGL